MPRHPRLAPLLERFGVRARLHEELHLHLLEFPRAEDEVPRRYLVPERFSYLRDPERHLLPGALKHVEIVDVDALCGLRPEVHDCGLLLDRPHERLEHEIEEARLGEGAAVSADGTLPVRLAGRALDARVVRSEAVLALPAIDQRIGESRNVARGLPDP